jgi:hypothetical protein
MNFLILPTSEPSNYSLIRRLERLKVNVESRNLKKDWRNISGRKMDKEIRFKKIRFFISRIIWWMYQKVLGKEVKLCPYGWCPNGPPIHPNCRCIIEEL